MALFNLNEPILRACVVRLTTELPATIAEINAETADGIDLEMPPADRILPIVPSLGTLRQWPVIGMQHLPGELTDDIGSSAVWVAQICVLAFESDADYLRLGWKLIRWERALESVLLEGRTLGADAFSVQGKGTRPGPTLGDSEDPEKIKTYTSWTGVIIEVRAEED